MEHSLQYNKNISVINIHHPYLLRQLEKPDDDDLSYTVLSTKSGLPTIEVLKEDKKIVLHSKIDPLKETLRFTSSHCEGDEQVFFVFGLGLGYQIEELLKKSEDSTIIVFEPSATLFRAALNSRDITTILKSDRVWLNIEKSALKFDTIALDPSIMRIKFLSLRPYQDLFPDIFKELRKEYISFLNRRQINTATIKRFDRLWTKNTFKNSGAFFTLSGVDELRDRFKAIPALVLSAGPSLEMDTETIIDLADNSIIIACDTAMNPLIKRGIVPDFVVTVDPQYVNSLILSSGLQFKKRWEDMPVLIADPAVYPTTLKNYRGMKILCSSVFSPGRVIERFSGIKGPIAAGGSVAVASYDFARVIGADPIILMGLDLSYSSSLTHLRGSFHEQYLISRENRFHPIYTQISKYITGGEPFKVNDKDGNPVLTDRRMMLYKSWFESQAPLIMGKTINASKKGLHIEGIEDKTLDELKKDIENIKANKNTLMLDLKSELTNIPISYDKAGGFISFLEKLDVKISELCSLSKRGEKLVHEVLSKRLFDKHQSAKLSSVTEELDAIDREILSHRDETQILNMVMQTPITEILKKTAVEDAHEAWERSKTLYASIDDGCVFLTKLLKISLEKLKKLHPDADIKNMKDCR
ncbi:MAG: motility associated factor glycosyltransferase family protein [Spirochaetota bacterium]|nr:MAG: motility associated factor glycosyltransferase family protein [Spirochaetota bacterium]